MTRLSLCRYLILCFVSTSTYGQTSNSAGDWETDANWVGGTAPNFDLTGETISIQHEITLSNTLTFGASNSNVTVDETLKVDDVISEQNNNTTLNINALFVVFGDWTFNSNGSLTALNINNGGILYIVGDMTSTGSINNININAGGALVVGGNFQVGGTINNVAGRVYSETDNTSVNTVGGGVEGSIADLETSADSGSDPVAEAIAESTVDSTLPVELVSYSAKVVDGKILLQWQTATELNNDFFTIEKAVNNGDFVVMDQVPGHGTVNSSQEYLWRESLEHAGVLHYRLSQTDFDGTTVNLGIRHVQTFDQFSIGLYPNPVTKNQPLRVQAPNTLNWQIFSLTGHLLRSGNTTAIDTSSLKKGVYIVSLGNVIERIIVN